jgi:predicted anti-sigma-YlaC factor YlaD
MNPSRHARALFLACALLPLAGCSVNKFAVNKLGDALASGGTTFAADDDPELVKQAVPFSLKLMESLLSESPNHRGLLLATSSGFTQYAFAFVQQDADELEATNFAAAQVLRARAKRLYLRARDYGLRGLSVRHPGFTAALAADPRAAVAKLTGEDVAQAYWTAAALGAAIGVGKDDPALIALIPQMEALIDRALVLDESWGQGAIHDFLITFEMSRQGESGDASARSRKHFERALELSGGRVAGTYVTFAEAVCVEQQDAAGFDDLLKRALAIDPDAVPAQRLANLVMQRRARWLLAQKDDLFLLPVKPANS